MFSYRFVRMFTALADLSRKRERDRLPIQRWPHYLKLAEGAYLGFRRGPDTWHARFRDRKGAQHYEALHGVDANDRSEERRVGKEGRSGGSPDLQKKKNTKISIE